MHKALPLIRQALRSGAPKILPRNTLHDNPARLILACGFA
jgi:hypothetical protein